MKNLKQLRRCLLIGFFGLSLALAGCSDGDDGAAGPAGPAGPEGPAAGDVVNPNNMSEEELAALTITAEITDVTIDSPPVVQFNVMTDDDKPVVGLTPSFIIAKLVPGSDGDPDSWQSYITRTETATAGKGPGGTAALESATQATSESSGTLVDNGDGTYQYTFTTDITALDAITYDSSLTHRVAIQISGNGVPAVNPYYDFVPDGGEVTTTRNIATVASCNECHGKLALHGGGRVEVEYCVTCHNPNTTDANSGIVIDFAAMVHSIHRGEELTNDYSIWGYRDSEHNYNEVLYPEAITNCEKCHTADAATPNGDNWKDVPTMNACGACHDDVNFADGTGHSGGARADNSGCADCHSATDIEGYHTVTPAAADTPEFEVTITMTAPDNGEYYVTGEAPVVTVTLAGVDGSVYTSTANDKGVTGGGLATADLDVYGPRAHAVPVLGAGSSLLASSANDASGFHFLLDEITDDLAPGTYMVRFEGGDYGAIAGDDYVTMSTALINFQIGTATVEAKVAGDCTVCHGENRMHLQGAHPHNAAFDTDECNACHDYSGGYGTTIARRVHAVHSAGDAGTDGHGKTWTKITFPTEASNCTICHNSESEAYKEPYAAYTLACVGCHGDNDATVNHISLNGGDLAVDGNDDLTNFVGENEACAVCHGDGKTNSIETVHAE
jgi:hypothetical protein